MSTQASPMLTQDARMEGILHAIAGSCGMIMESVINYPLDTLKTRYQLISSMKTLETPSIYSMTKSMIKSEGILTFYRGLPTVILMQGPRGFLKFGTNFKFQNIIHNNEFITNNITNNVNTLNFISGVGTGIIDGFLVAPFEFIKVRMQSETYLNQKDYRTTLHVLYNIFIKQRNISSLFIGLELTLYRNGIWHGIYFGCLSKQKNAVKRFENNKFNDFFVGCFGGGLGSVFSSPFDVAKSRYQNNIHKTKIPWAPIAIYNIAKNEGITALYRGFIPKLLRLGIGGGILMFSFELSLTFLDTVYFFCTRQV